MSILSPEFWRERPVVVTGHMGFKGAWLTCLLAQLGARTTGFGKDEREPLLYRTLSVPGHISVTGDVNDTEALVQALAKSGASVLVHLAAQPIVLTSYKDPLSTFRDNIMGTASVLEAARRTPTLEAIVIVTSDKVYENHGWPWGYRESDALGGHDPYSASKAAAEIVARSMFRSFFSGADTPGVATARAGNVIGGGDWGDYRLLPDAARAYSRGAPLRVRNPASTRPWQHVLEPLMGYLQLAQTLAANRNGLASDAWNFGPLPEDAIPVGQVVDLFTREWGTDARWQIDTPTENAPKEAFMLAVDSALSRAHLAWKPRWRVDEAVRRTAAWYRDYAAGASSMQLVGRDIDDYLSALN